MHSDLHQEWLQNHTFDELTPGQGATLQRLLTDADIAGFAAVSGDLNPTHLDDAYEPGAARAIELFTYRVVRECGALAACLGGVDVLGFTGGIGEHDATLRADVGAALAYLGVRIDAAANRGAVGNAVTAIHAADSTVQVWVVPTDEGRVAARDALALLG